MKSSHIGLLVLLEIFSSIKAFPVLHEHPTPLVEAQDTHGRGIQQVRGTYSHSSRDSFEDYHGPEVDHKTSRELRKQAIDTTLSEWVPPPKRKGETAKSYRARYNKARSLDRVNREAKGVVLRHIPDEEQASKVYVQFNQEERDRVVQNYEENRRLREAGLMKPVPRTPEERAPRQRNPSKNRNSAVKYRLREKIKKAKGPLDEKTLAKAKVFGLNPATIHEKPRRGRRSTIEDRVHAFLLKHGLVTPEALSAAGVNGAEIGNVGTESASESSPRGTKTINGGEVSKEAEKVSSAPNHEGTDTQLTAKRDFLDGVRRKPRTKKAKTDFATDQASSPSTPPGSEAQQRNGESTSPSSGGSSSSGSPFPRKKRTKTFVVPNENQNHHQRPSERTAHPYDRTRDHLVSSLDPVPQETRTKVANKRKHIQNTIRDIFGE